MISLILLSVFLGASAPAARPADSLRIVPRADTGRKTVAVLTFDNNTGNPDYNPLGKGMVAMMSTDLASVQEIRIVERERMQDLLKEMELQQTKYFDSTTAAKAGRLLGAQYVVTGAFITVQPSIRIDTRVIRVETGEVVKSAKVIGKEDQLFDLQQRLAKQLIDGLPIALSPESQQRLAQRQEETRLDSFATLVSFSQALASYDLHDYPQAVQKMASVVRSSPASARSAS